MPITRAPSGCRSVGDYQITVIINREAGLASLLDNCWMPVHFPGVRAANQRNKE